MMDMKLKYTSNLMLRKTKMVRSDYDEFAVCSGLVVEYRTPNWEVTGSMLSQYKASNLEQVANLLFVEANSSPNLIEWEMSNILPIVGYRVKA